MNTPHVTLHDAFKCEKNTSPFAAQAVPQDAISPHTNVVVGPGFPVPFLLGSLWQLDSEGSFSNRIGIIGAPRSKFNPHTLMPLGTLEEEEEGEGSLRTKTSNTSVCSRELTSASLRDSATHPCDMQSRATTEGDYSENNQ